MSNRETAEMGERRWDVVVVGGANSDFLIQGGELPRPGQTVEGEGFQAAAGGKGANQAVAVARLGRKAAFIGRVGDDERGRALLTHLVSEGIDTSHVLVDAEAPTGAALVQVDHSGQKQILTAPGANRNIGEADILAARGMLQEARVVLMQLEIPVGPVALAARLAREAGALVVLDPAPPAQLPEDLVSSLTVIRPNAHEAEVLTGKQVRDRDSALEAAREFLGRGVEAVAIQAGEEGNLLVWKEDELWMPLLPVESVDATGAGDAFAAAIAVGLAEGRPWRDIGPFANAAAAFATTKLGAQAGLPRRSDVQALLSRFEHRAT